MTADTQTATDDTVTGAFPVPFPADQLRADIQTILLLMARQLNFVFGRSTSDTLREQTSLLGLPASSDVNDPGMSAALLGFRYEMVQTTALAETLESLYLYAFQGIEDSAQEPMDSDSISTWVSVIIHDLANSAFIAEWEAYGPSEGSDGAAARCMLVCETAQARRVLEGHDDSFLDWAGSQGRGLSFRQMALLSGMTEASVRTLSNPKRRNALPTVSDGKNVYVEIAAAKQWLQVKGRYVPVKRTNRAGQLDLTGRKFIDVDELVHALDQRLEFMLLQPQADQVRRQLAAMGPALLDVSVAERPTLRLTRAQLEDRPFMLQIGQALELPAELLALRAAEVSARIRLIEIERLIQQQTRPLASSTS